MVELREMFPEVADYIYYDEPDILLLQGNCLDILPKLKGDLIQCCITSPPYWGLRDYGHDGQIGQEDTPEKYTENMRLVFSHANNILKHDGTLWLNLGDSYYSGNRGGYHSDIKRHSQKQLTNKGSVDVGLQCNRMPLEDFKNKDLIGIPWRVAFALQADGWYLRSDIIWNKLNPMPESVTDRPTKAHEYIFLMSKEARYYYDYEAIKEPAKWERWGDQTENKKHPGKAGHLGNKKISELPIKDNKNKRSVWAVATKPYIGAHFAVFPPELVEPCILAGTKEGDIVLDPFGGS